MIYLILSYRLGINFLARPTLILYLEACLYNNQTTYNQVQFFQDTMDNHCKSCNSQQYSKSTSKIYPIKLFSGIESKLNTLISSWLKNFKPPYGK